MIEKPSDIPNLVGVFLVAQLMERSIEDENGCRVWQGCLVSGYGTLKFRDTTYKAHRLMAFMLVDGWFEGAVVRHKCNNKACIEPDHLLWGTRKENSIDVVLSGGNRKTRNNGQSNGMAKLTNENVIDIKRMLQNGVSNKAIAAQFNVARSLISRIKTGDRRGFS